MILRIFTVEMVTFKRVKQICCPYPIVCHTPFLIAVSQDKNTRPRSNSYWISAQTSSIINAEWAHLKLKQGTPHTNHAICELVKKQTHTGSKYSYHSSATSSSLGRDNFFKYSQKKGSWHPKVWPSIWHLGTYISGRQCSTKLWMVSTKWLRRQVCRKWPFTISWKKDLGAIQLKYQGTVLKETKEVFLNVTCVS